MGTKDEVKQAVEDKEKTEESLKVLRKELGVLKNDLSKVEAITKAAKKKCGENWEVQSKLQEKFRAADAVREEAFVHMHYLRNNNKKRTNISSTKAKEAMKRKKKREEKAKSRAVLKAQKEAEEREKEREKKLRKKERSKCDCYRFYTQD
ncbi:hypothetical protein AALP_AAs53620U000100 [Arabis alpina]|uniref:Uncharacterized protein n=1 Tax=Arabis alpina TaxID=50452 RepID=A0A087G2U0_ARAAL|nr:hypothetical protein AALP_AAs53620U000100 [Arabis alpina]